MLTENQLFANRYRLVKRLGQGAFSEVWKAEDTETGNLTVALKVYAPDKGLDEDGAKVFSEEFAIVFNIHHQNLLTPTYYAKENGSPYLVLPFCEQGSSLKLVGKMDERQAVRFLRDVSAALAYLHESEIVHQDIKPDNVLMDSKGNFLVTDFGISTRIRSTLRRSVGDKKSAGTMAYMGPERFSKSPDPIKSSDIWSLGAAVFELMKGDVPFGDMGGGMQMAGALVPDIPGNYSTPLKQLVEQCLAKEPWDRPTAAQLRDICDHYMRTGVWDLSVLDKSVASEPERLEKPQEPVGRPTVRKVNAVKEPESPREETPTRQNPGEPKAREKENSGRRKWLPWVIGGVVTMAILLIVFLNQGPKAVTEEWVGETVETVDEEPTVLISDPETEALAKTYTVNDVSFTMIYVEGGTFTMGCTSEQGGDAFDDEKPVHNVTVNDFCIGETEVTQALWKAVMGSNPSSFKGDDRPVENVSWNDCQEFIIKLNQMTGKNFRLPTEAEWEYAARGGEKSQHYKYSGSNAIDEVAWYTITTNDNGTKPVKTKKANELGLYDMSGNVWEWCEDWHGSYSSSSQTNPMGPATGSFRVYRGGSWYLSARNCQVSYRSSYTPVYRFNTLGFRLALSE